MTTVNYISDGLKNAVKHWRLSMILYLIQLSVAVVIGFEVYQVMEASIGHSASVEEIIRGYNHTILRDFVNVHGASISPLLGQMRWIILVYAVYSVFLHGGILNVLIRDGADWTDFWKGGAQYFKPFLVYALLFVTLFMLWSAVIWLPTLGGLFSLIEAMDRERPIYWIFVAAVVIWILGVVWIYLVSLSTRYFFIAKGERFWRSIRAGLQETASVWKLFFPVVVFFVLVLSAIYGANFFFELQLGITSKLLILVFLLWQQIMVFIKIYLRIGLYSSLVGIMAPRNV